MRFGNMVSVCLVWLRCLSTSVLAGRIPGGHLGGMKMSSSVLRRLKTMTDCKTKGGGA
jgi:hypothetical protein